MSELILRHVTKTLKNRKVLKDITARFESGKIYGFYGRNLHKWTKATGGY